MRIQKLRLGLPILVCSALLATAAPAWSSTDPGTSPPAVTAEASNVVKGKVLGVSKKAKAITVETPKGSVTVKFDDATVGMEHAAAGEAAIVKYRIEGKNKVATQIEPKLATLPEGVSEITPAELVALLETPGAEYLLIDSRPAARFAEAHIPTAISIPVEKMGEAGKTMLPQDNKDIQLVFYCGGVT